MNPAATDDHLAAAALRQLERATRAGVATLDVATATMHWSPRTHAIFETDPSAFRPTLAAMLAFCTEATRSALESSVQNAMDTGRSWDVEFEIVTAGGRATWIRSTGEAQEQDGRRRALTITIEDTGARRERDSRQRLLMDRIELASSTLRVGFWERDLTTGSERWSDQLQRMLASDASASPAQTDALLERILPADREAVRQRMREVPASGAIQEIEYGIRMPSGEVRRMLSRSLCEYDEQGRPRHHYGTTLDITDIRAAEARSQLALARLQRAIEIGSVGLWERGVDGSDGYWSDTMFRLYGLAPSEPLPSRAQMLEYVHPDDRVIVDAAWHRIIGSDEPVEYEFRVTRPDGRVATLRSRACSIRDNDGRLFRAAGATIDISTDRAASEQLREYAEWIGLASAASGVGFFRMAPDFSLLSCDEQSREMFDFDADRLPSADEFIARVVEEDRASLAQARQEAMATSAPVAARYRVRDRRGNIRHVLTRRTVLRDARGEVQQIVGTVVDVTKDEESLRQRRELLDRLQLATENAGIGIWERDLITNRSIWDARTRKIMEVDDACEASFELWLARVHPDDRASVLGRHEKGYKGADRGESEYRILRPNGGVRIVRANFIVMRAANGESLRLLGTVQDVTALRESEQAAIDASERLILAKEAAGLGVWELSLADGRLVVDLQVRQMLQIGRDWDATLSAWLQCIQPDDRARVLAALDEARNADDGRSEVEYRVATHQGNLRFINQRFVLERDARDRPAKVLGTMLDVTGMRRTESERDELFHRMQLVSTSVNLGVWDWDLLTGESIWNDQMYTLFGRSREQFGSSVFLDVVHPQDVDRVKELLQGLRVRGSTFDVEFRVIWPDGAERCIASRGVVQRDVLGHAVRMIGVNWDTTERRRASAQVQDLLERLRHTTEATGLGFWEIDFSSGAITWDDQMYRLHGCRRGELQDLSQQWIGLHHPDDRARVLQHGLLARDETALLDIEARIVLPDGSLRYLAYRAQIQHDGDGRPLRRLGLAWDVTERKQAEQTRLAKESAERASQAKSEFLSRMSHELRTPLNAILGFAQVLDMDRVRPLAPAQRERVAQIQKAGWHLLALINEVLDLSRIEAGSMRLKMSAVAAQPLLDEVLTLIAPDAQQRRIARSIEIEPGAAEKLWVDPTRLRQVLLNLLSNAVKYNRDGGRIEVRVSPAGADETRIAVRDSGHGMTPEQQRNLFQPFNRLGRESEAIEGTGVGLSIARKLVELMGGRIEVYSEAGVGSEFVVHLQTGPDEGVELRTRQMLDASTRRDDVTGALLYVEDNPSNLALLRNLLELRPNVRLLEAESGESGLAMAAVSQPDIALIDMRLPDMDGLELLRRLRASPGTARLLCVALSANALRADRDAALEAGFADYWTKPFNAPALLEQLDLLLLDRAQREAARREQTGDVSAA